MNQLTRVSIIKIFLIVLSLIVLIIEAIFIPFPFVLLTSILLYVIDDSAGILLFLLVLSLILDSIKVHAFGFSSLYFFTTLLVISIYERAFEIKSTRFILFISFISSYLYMYFSSYSFNIGITVLVAGIMVVFYKFLVKSQIQHD